MDWLTSELTAIEKVRRNVVLLSALAGLLAFFPVRTDEISFFGARFTSDVVAFGIFHALMFYTIVLGVRAFIHRRLAFFDSDVFQSQLQAKLEETSFKIETAQTKRAQAHEQRRTLATIVTQQMDERIPTLKRRLLELREILNKSTSDDERAGDRFLEAVDLKAELQECEARLAQGRATLSEPLGEDAETSDLNKQLFRYRKQGPFVAFVGIFITIGEYAFPCVLGLVAAFAVLATQDFPMLWELKLR